MKRITTLLTAVGVFLCLTAAPVFAQHGGGHGGGMGQGAGMGQGGGMEMGSHGNSDMDHAHSMGMNHSQLSSMNHGKTPGELLTQNTKLSTKLQSLLPAGTNLQQAAEGFKNLGQFVAAVHVSKNLGIPFDDLKAKMMSGDSLGKAIHTLKPDANSKSEAKKGTSEAKEDIQESETESKS